MYAFTRYCRTTEQMMRSWYEHSASSLSVASDLGAVREHFINSILKNFLPQTTIVGRGEIIDGTKDGRSGQQDIILYRADFPVITSHTSINTFLIEGVLATIEVKSDLSKECLTEIFNKLAKVKSLEKEAIILSDQEKNELDRLKYIHSVKTFIVAYKGWKTPKALVNQFRAARQESNGIVPDVLYYPGNPGFCLITDSILGISAFVRKEPFAYFFQRLLKAIIEPINPIATIPGSGTKLKYTFNRYFSLDLTKAQNVDDPMFD